MRDKLAILFCASALILVTIYITTLVYEEQTSWYQIVHDVAVEKCGGDDFTLDVVHVVHIPFMKQSTNYVCKCSQDMTWDEAEAWGHTSGFYDEVQRRYEKGIR